MSEKLKNQKGGQTDVKTKIIDFDPLDTKTRKDDDGWNTMQFYGKTDGDEAKYESQADEKLSLEAQKGITNFRARKLGKMMIQAATVNVA